MGKNKHIDKVVNLFIVNTQISSLVIFILLLIPVVFASFLISENAKDKENIEINRIIKEIDDRLEESIDYARLSVFTIAMTIDNEGIPQKFDSIAAKIIAATPYLDALQLAPKGVIKYTYPQKGNEAATGLDILNDKKRNLEALNAIKLNRMYFAGPFKLIQGGTAVIGRMPIYTKNKFWGFSAVIIRLERLIEIAGFNDSKYENYNFQFSKVNPNTNKEEFFLPIKKGMDLEKSHILILPEGDWTIYISAANKKTLYFKIAPFLLIGAFFAFFSSLYITSLLIKPRKLLLIAEDNLKKSELKFKTLTDNAPIGIYFTNTEGYCTYTNEKWRAYAGMDENGPLSLGWQDALHPDDKDRVFEEWKESAKKNMPFSSEYRFLDKNNVTTWLKGKASTLVNVDGESIGFIGTVLDITKEIKMRDKVNLALDEKNGYIERYEMVLKATNEAIFDWDIVENITWGNNNLYELYEMDASKGIIDNKLFLSHIHINDIEKVKLNVFESLENKLTSISDEFRFKTKGELYKTLYYRAFIIYNDNGIAVRMIGAMQDITERKSRELEMSRAIIETQETERQEIGMELHDNVNQILSATVTMINLFMQEPSSSEYIEKAKEYCKKAISEIRGLSHRLAPTTFIDTTMQEAFENVISSINNKRYDVNIEFDEYNYTIVDMNIKLTLFRVLQEQLTNIIKHAKATSIAVKVNVKDNSITMITSDNGQGFNVDKSKKGLGQYNMKRRVELISGSIEVISSAKSGTEITINVPLI